MFAGGAQAAFESCFGVSHGCSFVELSGSESSKMVFTDRRACNIRIDLLCSVRGQGARSKDLQFIYVNRRFVRSKRVAKLLNSLMETAVFGHGQATSSSLLHHFPPADGPLSRATTASKIHPIFALKFDMDARLYNARRSRQNQH